MLSKIKTKEKKYHKQFTLSTVFVTAESSEYKNSWKHTKQTAGWRAWTINEDSSFSSESWTTEMKKKKKRVSYGYFQSLVYNESNWMLESLWIEGFWNLAKKKEKNKYPIFETENYRT